MQFCCLGSGSKGNTTLVRDGDTTLMIDCGFSVRHVEARLASRIGSPGDITAILVTHEHADHINGVAALARKWSLPVYASRGTAKTGKLDNVTDLRWISPDRSFRIGSVEITPVIVPHDAHEPCQFRFDSGPKRLGVMTDLGSVSPYVQQAFAACDALLLEANHDLDMLWSGRYPARLKQRVAGDWGHLSNCQAERFVRSLNLDRLQTLVLGHISEENNHPEIVRRHFAGLESRVGRVAYATQDDGFDWISI